MLSKPSPSISPAQIRAARGLVGWTQAELARRVGLRRLAIQRIELEITKPRAGTADRILRAFAEAGVVFDRGGAVLGAMAPGDESR